MADEYIKREDAIKAMWKALYDYEDKTEKQFTDDPNLDVSEWFMHRIFVQVVHAKCLDAVEAIPSADVQKVRHGEWFEKETFRDENADIISEWQSARCSVCDKYHTTPFSYCFMDYEYCPHCGAIMDKDGDGDVV